MKTNKRHQLKRNIGIIAHVDAGKTTVSERVLYYTGKIHTKGETHDGGSKMDRGTQEKLHGITISSAATTVNWRDHEINLIDTPGHVDFGIEVKRSLRVLDGAVVVFDAVSGVEPQTETNWRLANDFGVAKMAFINKMDRPGADFERVIGMMTQRLDVKAVPVQLPITDPETHTLVGIIDLVSLEYLTWSDTDGKELQRKPIPKQWESEANTKHHELVEHIIEYDEALLEAYLESGTAPSTSELQSAIRLATVSHHIVPVLCGTALKNRGIQPLLDAVVDYLPSPMDKALPAAVEDGGLLAYAFKTAHHGSFGSQTWLRLYAGSIEPGSRIYNSSKGCFERISRIVRMNSDEAEDIARAEAGDIVAVVGLKDTHTGDTLADAGSDTILESLAIPEPVTRVVIEAASRSDREKLGLGLKRLTTEDPTLQISVDAETGQSILSGMGELHLEMAREKLEEELNLSITFGQPEVSYRETIQTSADVTYLHKKQDGGPGQYAQVSISVEPLARGSGFEFESQITGGAIPADYIPGVEKGIAKAMLSGVIDGHQVVDIRVVLVDGRTHSDDSSLLAFENAGFHALKKALVEARPILLEPVMKVAVTTPTDHVGDVIGDLTRRRGLVNNQEPRGSTTEVSAEVPLAKLFGYISDLRSMTSGRANFTMEFQSYEKLAA